AVPATSSNTANRVAVSKSDVINLFVPFTKAVDQIKKSYVEPTDEQRLFYASLQGMLKAFPFAQRLSFAGTVLQASSGVADKSKLDLNAIYNAAVEILNDRSTSVDQARLLQAAFDGMLGGLDPHSSYLDAKSFRDMQVQTRGEFGGLGIEVTMEDGL